MIYDLSSTATPFIEGERLRCETVVSQVGGGE